MSHYKPDGYNSVSPYLVVKDARALIAQLEKIFDARTLRLYETPDGGVHHAELMIDDSVVMIGEAPSGANQPTVLHVYVDDVDKVYAKAMAAGCTVGDPPHVRDDDPDKRGSFRDLAGNMWAIGMKVDKGN